MKKQIKGYIAGIITGVTIMFSLSGYAEDGLIKIEAFLRPDLPIMLDGKRVTLESAPITYDGNTFLKLRDVTKLTGMGVNWNQDTQTVELTSVTGSTYTNSIATGTKVGGIIMIQAKPITEDMRTSLSTAIKTKNISISGNKVTPVENNDVRLVTFDDNQYVSVYGFGVPNTELYKYNPVKHIFTFTIKGANTEIEYDGRFVSEYGKGIGAFTYGSDILINITKLGLTAHYDSDNAIVIE